MKNVKIKFLTVTTLIILIIISALIIKLNENNKTTLTQLSPQGKSQMMGYLIKTNNGKIVLIDGGIGEDTQNLIKTIKNNGEKVDYWFLTHAHNDHTEAFTKVVEETDIQIDNIYVSLNDYKWYEENEPSRKEFTKKLIEVLSNQEIKNKVKEPQLNENIQIDNLNVEILGIKNPEITDNPGNEQSMILKINTGKNTLLILGDIGEKGSKKLIDNQKDKLKSDIVQMSHHGQAGATEELYKIVEPKICMWPTPDWLWDNNSGEGIGTGPWKTLETRSWIEKLLVRKNYVAKDGDITIDI